MARLCNAYFRTFCLTIIYITLICYASYNNQGRYSEAEPLYQQALELRKKLLGEEHPDVATSLNNLAGLYNNQGRNSEAEPLYQEAIIIATKTLGENHPNTKTISQNYQIMKKKGP